MRWSRPEPAPVGPSGGASAAWRSPEELVEAGFGRSRVVMVDEAYDGMRRCLRTREVGRRLLPAARRLGVRHLAMEALQPRAVAAEANASRRPAGWGALAPPEMRRLVQDALDLGWELVGYEADFEAEVPAHLDGRDLADLEVRDWREAEAARHLAAALAALPAGARLLVWCGMGHHGKAPLDGWEPVGLRFWRLTGVEPFTVSQIPTVHPPAGNPPPRSLTAGEAAALRARGRTAGFLREDDPRPGWRPPVAPLEADAYLLSLDNDLE